MVPRLLISDPRSRNIAQLSLRYPIQRGRLALSQNGAVPPPCPRYLVSHGHICAIPHSETYRDNCAMPPIKTSTNEFCNAIATSIARYEEYRSWASKLQPTHLACPCKMARRENRKPENESPTAPQVTKRDLAETLLAQTNKAHTPNPPQVIKLLVPDSCHREAGRSFA